MNTITDRLADALRRLANLAEDTIDADDALLTGARNAREALAAYDAALARAQGGVA